jgi:hypothetical protein
MAFGFQNCCDGKEYFYVNNIPNTVSELEVYYIDTEEGLDFCASYVELPELFYQPKTYNLVGMTAQTNCLSCTTSHPCPDIIDDNIDELSSYITTTSNECAVITESFFEVSCGTISPSTFLYPGDGQLSVSISGGIPPYFIYSAGTSIQYGGASNPGMIPVIGESTGGQYSFDVVDFTQSVKTITCTIPSAPSVLTTSCNTQNITQFGLINGKLFYPTIQGGTPPYSVYSGSTLLTQSNFPILNLSVGSYNLIIRDSGTGDNFQQKSLSCAITQPAQVFVYPTNLCLQFEYCGKGFSLSFVSAYTENNRAFYSSTNASIIGLGAGEEMSIYWDGFKWTSSQFNSVSPITLPNGCSTNTVSSTFTGPTTQYPMGSWSINSSSWLRNDGVNNTIFTLYSGTCQNTTINPTITTLGYCSTSTTPQGVVTFSPVVGGSSPYTFIVDNNLAGSNVTTTSVTNLTSGSHTYTITDQTGSTVTGSFNIPSTPGSTVSLSLSSTDNTPPTSYTNSTVQGVSVRSIYRDFNIDITIPNLPNGVSLQGYFEVLCKGQIATTNNYTQNLAGSWPDYISNPFISVKKNTTTINSSITSTQPTDSGSITRLTGNVSPNFIPTNNNNTCTFNTSTFTRKVKKTFYIGSSSSPLSILNSDVFKLNLNSGYNFRTNSTTTCRPGIAWQYDIKFIPTSTPPNCVVFDFGNYSTTSFRQTSGNNSPQALSTAFIISY